MKYNMSKTYLLPLLSEFVEFDMKFMKYLINTYLFDPEGEYKDCICILHEFSFKNPDFTAYEHKLINNEYFVKNIDVGNKVIYVFKFPENYLREYKLFQEGKYSQFGDYTKELILKFWSKVYSGNQNAVPALVRIKQILYKEAKLREKLESSLNVKIDEAQELADIIDIESETFKISEFESKD